MTSSISSFTKAKHTLDKDKELEERKAAAKAKSKAKAQPKAKAGATAAAGNESEQGGCQLFNLDLARSRPVLSFSEPPSCEAIDYDQPWVHHHSPIVQEVAEASPAKLNLLIFKAGFAKTERSRDVKVLNKADHLRARLFDVYGPKDRLLDTSSKIKDFYVWAMKKGAEYAN
eukprot:15447965-Alexandrium_andersonii.AAC.1